MNFRKSSRGGGSFSIQKFMLQIFAIIDDSSVMNFRKNCNITFRKFIRFGGGRLPLCTLGRSPTLVPSVKNHWYKMEFWRTICSPTVERSRTNAHSVKRQTKKVVIWELISSFILVRSWFNCKIQFKNIHYAINRGRNEMRKCCIFCPCMRLMRIKIFTCTSRCAYPHMRIIRMNRMDPQPHGQA